MNVLWITNTMFPAVCKELGLPSPVVGGWMYTGAECLIKTFNDIKLGVATLYSGSEFRKMELENVTYFLLPRSKPRHIYDEDLEILWKKIKRLFLPDLVHIHGTEYPIGLSYVNACGHENVVVSIQGLIHVIERYYYSGLNESDLLKNITIRDLIKRDSIIQQRLKLKRQGEYEISLLKKLEHVIGRTTWDRTHVWTVNTEINYYHCNESLRREFYKHKWQESSCNRYQIFVSQSHYTIKGFHQVVKALPLILEHYPDTQVVVAGDDFFKTKKNWKTRGYQKYLQSLIRTLNVKDKIYFTGALSEDEMCAKYLESNVFVSPSSIENSSNSIGESQLLGTPCIASYVGGTSDLIIDGETGLLYRFEEYELLAKAVCRIFDDKKLTQTLSKNGRDVAMKRHNQTINTKAINAIYQKICKI